MLAADLRCANFFYLLAINGVSTSDWSVLFRSSVDQIPQGLLEFGSAHVRDLAATEVPRPEWRSKPHAQLSDSIVVVDCALWQQTTQFLYGFRALALWRDSTSAYAKMPQMLHATNGGYGVRRDVLGIEYVQVFEIVGSTKLMHRTVGDGRVVQSQRPQRGQPDVRQVSQVGIRDPIACQPQRFQPFKTWKSGEVGLCHLGIRECQPLQGVSRPKVPKVGRCQIGVCHRQATKAWHAAQPLEIRTLNACRDT